MTRRKAASGAKLDREQLLRALEEVAAHGDPRDVGVDRVTPCNVLIHFDGDSLFLIVCDRLGVRIAFVVHVCLLPTLPSVQPAQPKNGVRFLHVIDGRAVPVEFIDQIGLVEARRDEVFERARIDHLGGVARSLSDAQREAVVHQVHAHVVVRVNSVDLQQLVDADAAD